MLLLGMVRSGMKRLVMKDMKESQILQVDN